MTGLPERGGEQRGQRRDVAADRLDVRGDRVDADELLVDVRDRGGDLAQQRHRLVGEAGDQREVSSTVLASLRTT
jgi:hypothetical protein